MNHKISRLLTSELRLYFICLVVFAAIQTYFSPHLGIAELLILAALYFYHKRDAAQRQKEILRHIESFSSSVDLATKDTMVNSPLPMVIFRPQSGEVIWSNERFLRLAGNREHMFDTLISAAVPGFDSRWLLEGKNQCPTEIALGGRQFLVFGQLVRSEGTSGTDLATTYWIDVTDYSILREDYYGSRPVAAILLLDNYEEFMKNVEENDRSALLSDINKRLVQWTAGTDGLFCRYDRGRFLLVFEERYLSALKEEKFSVLDSVREVKSPNGIQATLSIGIGKDAPTLKELFQYASLSIDMALSRGGDQAVIKNRFHFEFFGGKAKETEKQTKVKSRVMANALSALIADSSRVFIMGHKFPDLDTVGAAAGVCAIARKRGIPAYIVHEQGRSPGEVMTIQLASLPEYGKVLITPEDALIYMDSGSLLVIVDTNRPENVQSPALLESCNRVAVIDHHRRAASYVTAAAFNFHEPFASSASELVTELIQQIMEPSDLLRLEAEALMAGIVLDTKNFTLSTGGRTFEAAAFLRRSGADTSEVKKLFQNNLAGTIARYDIIRNAYLYRDELAVAKVNEAVGQVTAAQAADELLNILGISASFVLFPDTDRIMISARSIGETNVQVIMEKLGGGGNSATAGAQLTGVTLDEAAKRLIAAIDQYFEDE